MRALASASLIEAGADGAAEALGQRGREPSAAPGRLQHGQAGARPRPGAGRPGGGGEGQADQRHAEQQRVVGLVPRVAPALAQEVARVAEAGDVGGERAGEARRPLRLARDRPEGEVPRGPPHAAPRQGLHPGAPLRIDREAAGVGQRQEARGQVLVLGRDRRVEARLQARRRGLALQADLGEGAGVVGRAEEAARQIRGDEHGGGRERQGAPAREEADPGREAAQASRPTARPHVSDAPAPP